VTTERWFAAAALLPDGLARDVLLEVADGQDDVVDAQHVRTLSRRGA